MDYKITQTVLLPEKPRPIASIDTGGIVKDSHYPAYQKAGFTVAGLYDLNPVRSAEMAELFHVSIIYPLLADAASQAPADALCVQCVYKNKMKSHDYHYPRAGLIKPGTASAPDQIGDKS